MQRFTVLSISAALMAASVAPAIAQSRLTPEQLIEYATAQNVCGDDLAVVGAEYLNDTDNRISVRCGEATGFAPAVAAAGLGASGATVAAVAGLGLAAAVAGGGGGSTPDTQ